MAADDNIHRTDKSSAATVTYGLSPPESVIVFDHAAVALRPRCARAARCRGAAALFPACSSLAEQRCCARRVPPAAATALCARKREGVAGQAAREASRARVRSGCSSLHADCPGQASVAGRVHPGKPRHQAARRAICCTCLRAVLRPPTAVQPAPPPSDPNLPSLLSLGCL